MRRSSSIRDVLLVAALAFAFRRGNRQATSVDPERAREHASRTGQACFDVEDVQPSRRQFVRVWVVPLILTGMGFLAVGAVLLRDLIRDEAPTDWSGGALLTVESDRGSPRVAVEASLRDTGYEGDWLRLEVTALSGLAPGTRWYLYVSGLYRPPDDAELESFCSNATIAVRDGPTIRCPDDPGLLATTDVEYRRDEELGFPVGDHVEGVVGHAFYDATDVTTITGVFSPEGEFDNMWVINVPVADIELGRSGSERQGRLAAIAVNDFEWGASGETLEGAPPPSPDASMVSESTGRTLQTPDVETFSFEADYLLGTDRLVWSNPEAAEVDTLYWTERSTSYEFASLRAGTQGSAALRGFVAGVFISAGVGILLLLAEKTLERTEARQRRPRRA